MINNNAICAMFTLCGPVAAIFMTSKMAAAIGEVTAKHKQMRALPCGRSCGRFPLMFTRVHPIHSCSHWSGVLGQIRK